MGRNEEGLIDPAWLTQARRNRRKFVLRVVLVFAIFSILAFFVLPGIVSRNDEILKGFGTGKKDLPALSASMGVALTIARWFTAFWAVIGAGCAALVILALLGRIDGLLPVLSFVLFAAGAGAVAFTFYVFYGFVGALGPRIG